MRIRNSIILSLILILTLFVTDITIANADKAVDNENQKNEIFQEGKNNENALDVNRDKKSTHDEILENVSEDEERNEAKRSTQTEEIQVNKTEIMENGINEIESRENVDSDENRYKSKAFTVQKSQTNELVLELGVRDKRVIELKQDLMKLGFVSFKNPNEYFGTKTRQAVKDFQKYYGLTVTGVADNGTVKKLENIASTPLQRGKSHDSAIKLKEDLTVLGYLDFKAPTTYYGIQTEQAVRNFQRDYGLVENGIGDPLTLEKLDSVANGALQYGMSRSDVVKLKQDLMKLGFVSFKNPNEYFGTKTRQAVKDFQSHFGLIINGIAEENTLAKIQKILSSEFQKGNNSKGIKKLKENLVTLGYATFSNPNGYYGVKTEKAVKEFQKNNNLPISGIADEITLSKIEAALKGITKTVYNITLDEALAIQMKARPQTDQKYAYVSKRYIDSQFRVTANKLNVRSGASTDNKIVGTLSKGDTVKVISEYNGWYVIEFRGSEQWVDARPEDVRYYLNPNNFVDDAKQRFQFLDLSKGSAASAATLNKFLHGKGILQGKGSSFIEASTIHGINDIYLISHALLETGNGASKLANGVEVGKNKSGELVLVNSNNRSSLRDIKKVYNMYGIGAYDNCALSCGAKYAYENGWTTPERAIIRGAAFIGNSYIKSGLNTLYKMRWNPEAMAGTGKYGKQYATDIGWASKQINSMYNLYQQIGNYTLYLDIPVYKK